MTAQAILKTLRSLGKPQTAAIYRRHGAGDDVFGVLTSELAKLAKQIRVDATLSRALWFTGNAEARVLSLLIADATALTKADAEAFVRDGPIRFVGSYLAALVARSPIADLAMRAWMKSRDASLREMGYTIFAVRLKNDAASIADTDCEETLATIEKQITRSPNWARYAMNNALIAIGVYKPALREEAIAAAKRRGTIDVDHGETGCKTPDAAAYIEKATSRRR